MKLIYNTGVEKLGSADEVLIDGGTRILIVGGSADVRAELRRTLEHDTASRCVLTEAQSVAAGVHLCLGAGEAKPDCVLIVHEPPTTDALALLSALRGEHALPPCPIVVLSPAASGRALQRALLRAGAMEHLGEGATRGEALLHAVEDAIERFALTRRADEVSRTSEERYRAIFQSLDEGLCLIRVLFDEHDRPYDYLFLETNAAFEKHTGLVNAVGKTARELVPDLDTSWFELYGRVAATGEAVRVENHAPAMNRWFDVYACRAGAPSKRQVAVVFTDVTERRRTEQALRESEARAVDAAAQAQAERRLLDSVLEAAPAGIIVAATGGKLVRMNPANERLWGLAPFAESIDEYREWKGWWADGSERHGRPIEVHEWAMTRALHGESVRGDIIEIEPFDAPGKRRTMMNSAEPVRDASGAVVGAVVAQMNITALVNAETAVRRSEERYRLVGRATNDVIWDWDLETDGLAWNDAVVEQFGCTQEELGPTIHGWYDRIHPDDRERVVHGIHAAIDGDGESWSDEYRFRRSDGSYASFLDRGHIGRDDSGKAVRMIGSMLDLTERHRAEAALRESQARFRALADNMSQLAWIGDEKGTLFWYNQRWFEYTGSTLEEMHGWGWQKVHHPDHVERVTAKFQRHLDTHEAWEDTFPLRSKDGEYRWFLSRAIPIHDESGNVVRWFGTNTDITAQREAEETLRQAVALRDDFLTVAAHELRTPLTALSLQLEGFKKMLDREPPADGGRSSKKIETAIRQCARLGALIEGLLDVSRIASGRFSLELERFDLNDVVHETVERLSDMAARAGCEIRVTPSEAVVGTWDRSRLDQALMNLLTNAIKYGPKHPIDVDVTPSEGGVELHVRDRGIGISEADQQRIFGRFERAVSSNNYGGLGLGLYITHEIVQAHGGSIEVRSSPGSGTTFVVQLPRVTHGHVAEASESPRAELQ